MRTNRLLLLTIFLFLSFTTLFAQSKLSGVVLDEKENVKLEKATVTLLNSKDSLLQSFTWTKEGGKFLLQAKDTGQFKLLITYPQYADLVKDIHLTGGEYALGDLKLSKSALLLDEILINRKTPIVIKGDTIEYDAASFKVDKDAKVEDLLKVLPGITIGADGKITAQGKEVQKVLLDGEEFFGDDPKLITKNIRSDMVDKVQVYEKRSDLAVSTGIDDGVRTQTIDIKLKEDKKKGMFGDILAGIGTDKYYTGKAMINRFKGPQKVSLYGVTANDGMVGLSFEEGQKYGTSSMEMSVSDGGMTMFSSSGGGDGMDGGSYWGSGVPRALNLGASYSDKFKGDKHKLNVNYRRGQMDVENNSYYFAQNNLPERARIDSSYTYSDNGMKSNISNMRYDLKIDSLTDLTFKMSYNQIDRDNYSSTQSNQQDLDGTRINETNSNNNSDSQNENTSANVMLVKRFKKPRRSITLNTSIYDSDYNNQSNFYTSTRYQINGNEDIIDQLKVDNTTVQNLNGSINYTEPLSKRMSATVGYTFSQHKSGILNQSFNKNTATGEYDVLDQSVLNDFDNKNFTNQLGTSLNYRTEKVVINASNNIGFEGLERTYNNLNKVLSRDRVSYTPSLSVRYSFTKTKSISVNYYGRTLQPGLDQIEPLKQNAQQLVTYLDNFDLKSGFSNSINIWYNSYKAIKSQSFYLSGNIIRSSRAITSRVDMDLNTGKRTIQSINLDKDNWSGNLSGNFSFLLDKKMGINLSSGLGANYTNNYSYLAVNNGLAELNNNQMYGLAPRIGMHRYKDKGLSVSLSVNPGIQYMKSSLQPELNSNIFRMSSNGSVSYRFPKDILLSFNMNQEYEAATKTMASYSNFNLNGFVSKKFLKDKSLEVQLLVNDILNRNIGIRRSQSGYVFSQTSNDVLRRYGMFKLTYSFTTMKGDK